MVTKKLILLGATGSIGASTLNVVRQFRDRVELVGIVANRSVEKLSDIAREFSVKHVAICDTACDIFGKFSDDTMIYRGIDGICEMVSCVDADDVLVAIVGIDGILPTISAIRSGKNILLASKEVLVAAGHIVMRLAREYGVNILPVDSEHNAISQCLRCGKNSEINRLILTASGGALRDFPDEDLKNVTPAQTLRHPNWSMGARITIDSATFANKGLEVIEAHWLFGVRVEKIDVIVHRESLVHSMVEFVDGSVIMQMCTPNMEFSIRNCVFSPERVEVNEQINFAEIGKLTFEMPSESRCKCLHMAYNCLRAGVNSSCVFNAADEVAVSAFLSGKISFLDIETIVERTLNEYSGEKKMDLESVFLSDKIARGIASKFC